MPTIGDSRNCHEVHFFMALRRNRIWQLLLPGVCDLSYTPRQLDAANGAKRIMRARGPYRFDRTKIAGLSTLACRGATLWVLVVGQLKQA